MSKNPFKPNLQDKASEGNSNAKVITPHEFITAYFVTSEAFLEYGKSLRDSEVDDLRKLFNLLNLGLRNDGNLDKRDDRGKRSYVYPRFYQGRSTPGCKVILAGELEQFLTDALSGEITVNFTLDDVILAASE